MNGITEEQMFQAKSMRRKNPQVRKLAFERLFNKVNDLANTLEQRVSMLEQRIIELENKKISKPTGAKKGNTDKKSE